MCTKTGDFESLVREYLRLGLSKAEAEEAAHTEISHKQEFLVHADEEISKIQEYAAHLNQKIAQQKALARELYKAKRQQQLSQKQKTITPYYRHAKKCTDPNGRQYNTVTLMCQEWGVLLCTYCNRRAKGWTMLEALQGRARKKKTFTSRKTKAA